ncbi:hypothetical protein [Microvirga lotononidis]|uniref:Uncharacterized protein n=1 Tax=Microvirga lotononidis TaxID=864069 RepID=I4YVR1_9HYPH|nr:hypothetical protein [Microvirga lotononidis]EIM28053.1 hypothetical protein MicloDRAFT_00046300 [Microvirga lotononidis]WQO27838.1 hypothetical protein U0023_01630 [Microvirga lotononidis]
MSLSTSGSDDEPHPVLSVDKAGGLLGTGLPAAWWPSVGSVASLMFAIFWMLQSWEEAKPLVGATKVNYLTQGLAGLMVALLCSCGIYRFWKERSETIGIVLGALLAAAAMTLHRM